MEWVTLPGVAASTAAAASTAVADTAVEVEADTVNNIYIVIKNRGTTWEGWMPLCFVISRLRDPDLLSLENS